ncbi:hypothetical protein Q8F55_004307 [Vanrija albida]|uniref:UBA domain-containing protein n=1 Tax=Vanrija albida TaxID=181172 RepID=A0ABR3Q6M8_9TREE
MSPMLAKLWRRSHAPDDPIIATTIDRLVSLGFERAEAIETLHRAEGDVRLLAELIVHHKHYAPEPSCRQCAAEAEAEREAAEREARRRCRRHLGLGRKPSLRRNVTSPTLGALGKSPAGASTRSQTSLSMSALESPVKGILLNHPSPEATS